MAGNKSLPILVIEDEADIADLITLHLKRSGYLCEIALSGSEAITLLEKKNYSMVLLDWMLPDLEGIQILHLIKDPSHRNQKTPLIMVTAKSSPEDIIQGLDKGADDYIVKPFDPKVLIARVQASLRRSNHPSKILTLGTIRLDCESHQVWDQETPLALTVSEFKLLQSLMENTGKVLTRSQLIELVQGQGIKVIDRAIDTHVFGLRKKLGKNARLIHTIRGVGYRVGS